MAALGPDKISGCSRRAAIDDGYRAAGAVALCKNADPLGYDIARVIHADRAVVAIGLDADAGVRIDAAAIGDADRLFAANALARML